MGSSFDTELEAPEYEGIAQLAESMVYRLPGCSDTMIRKCLSEAYRDFCKRTCAIRTTRTVALESGVSRYRVAATSCGCAVDCVLSVSLGGRELDEERYRLEGGSIVFHRSVVPQEGETAEAEVVCAEVPKVGSEQTTAEFVCRYGDAVANGAMYRLFAMTNRPWSDPAQAALCATEYENAVTEARTRHYAGGALAGGRVNFIKKGCLL